MNTDCFISRHNGPRPHELQLMFEKIGVKSFDELIYNAVPDTILLNRPLDLPEAQSIQKCSNKLRKHLNTNIIYKSLIGYGYYDTITPAVIRRNVLENPSWYTPYTPYQAEISQGRLEALINFQTAITELTGMEIANASLLDEATAAAEAMTMMYQLSKKSKTGKNRNILFVDDSVFIQTLEVIKTRAVPLGIEIKTGKYTDLELDESIFGAVVQYPAENGSINDYREFVQKVHANSALITVSADVLSLALLSPPGEWDADIVVGSTQRMGVPMYFGGPHAAYFATREKYKRNIPGRIIGVTKDRHNNPALRMALQTREQHIKRERATSNICTAQALLATMAGMYAIYHGYEGIRNIALQIHSRAGAISELLESLGYRQEIPNYFDTLQIQLPEKIKSKHIQKLAESVKLNLRYINDKKVALSIDEATSIKDVNLIINVFATAINKKARKIKIIPEDVYFSKKHQRTSGFFTQDVFKRYRTETEMMRYIKKLELKDISLTRSMIPLGSCTMKLTPAQSMFAMTWEAVTNIHPYAPKEQTTGYLTIFKHLRKALKEITGFYDVSFQPNSGAAGEFTGLMLIREYHKNNKQPERDIVLIPASAHGTNPASAVMSGMKVVIVDCDANGNIDVDDLRSKAEQHKDKLAGFMVTYPSTHGVFEKRIIETNEIIHDNGGLVYMDGANMNALIGISTPAKLGADVCHLNLHKTFAIPHGGGGPGAGPIAVAKHLAEFLPKHPLVETGGNNGIGPIAAAPWGSASILTISHVYIKLLGNKGLSDATKYAILNANYIAFALNDYYQVLYAGENGYQAHEVILDCREFKKTAGIEVFDIAKRMIDYGFHAPTVSFPVQGTLMIEPTESESLTELNRFIEVMIAIRKEIDEIINGEADKTDNVLKNAPHTAEELISDEWTHPYTRQKAAYPLSWLRENKYFAPVARVNDVYGDRNFNCSCTPIEDYRNDI